MADGQNQSILTVAQAAQSYDLTDLATAKEELGIETGTTTYDTWLARGISQVSKAIASECDRVFPVETLSETTIPEYCSVSDQRWASNLSVLQLTRWPVVAIISISEDEVVLTENVDFRADYAKGHVYRLSTNGDAIVPWRMRTIVASYVSGYSASTTETKTIPSPSGPYTVTVNNAGKFGMDSGVAFTGGAALTKVSSLPSAGQYSVSAAGVYTFNSADASKSVAISYAYTRIPDDLVEAVLRLMTMRFKGWKRDPMLMSETNQTSGDRRYWVGNLPGQDSAFPPEIAKILDNYRVPVVG